MTSVLKENGHPEEPEEFIRDVQKLITALVYVWPLCQDVGSHLVSFLPAISREDQLEVSMLNEFYERYFTESGNLGEGGFGMVFKVQRKSSGARRAVKKVVVPVTEVQLLQQAKKEAVRLAGLSHDNVVQYYYSWVQQVIHFQTPRPILDALFPNQGNQYSRSGSPGSTHSVEEAVPGKCQETLAVLHIEMELCHSDLRSHLQARNQALADCKKPDDKTVQESLEMFRKIMEGVKYIHSKGITHKDIKTSNIFIGFNGEPKLGDFGFPSTRPQSRSSLSQVHSSGGTSENSTHQDYTPRCMRGDIHSLGFVLFDLLIPFRTDKRRTEEIRKLDPPRMPDVLKRYPKNMKDLVCSMCQTDEHQMPTAQEILANALFTRPEELTGEEAIHKQKHLP